jgi:glycosyltransferase involved in cell wall biosynthesis
VENKVTFHIIANAAMDGIGISGGDRIFIECARHWAEAGSKVNIYAWEGGLEMCERNKLNNVTFVKWSASRFKRFSFFVSYLARTVKGCKEALKILPEAERKNVVYSASDFLPDLLPSLILKLRFGNKVKWVCGFYLFVPNPFSKGSFYVGTKRFKAILYYITQKFTYPMVMRHADMFFVTNDVDRYRFINKRLLSSRVIAVKGGIDAKTPSLIPEQKVKTYDAIFIGRLCLEKGVRELIDIWKIVCESNKAAKLAILGTGPFEAEVRDKIKKYNLEKNVTLFGFIDGIEKFQIIKKSKIVVHPSIIDSGGMAACEAMACGLPGVSFDIPALRSYYPKGMIKTPCYSLEGFAENILKLLSDDQFYQKTSKDALDFALKWDWSKRAEELFDAVVAVSC